MLAMVKKLWNVKYDLILLEEKMEPLNGFETMKKLNKITENEITVKLTIFILSIKV